jgi:hypothetical protein
MSFCDERVVDEHFELAIQLHRFHGGQVAGGGSPATTNEQDPGGSNGEQVLRAERGACLPLEKFFAPDAPFRLMRKRPAASLR